MAHAAVATRPPTPGVFDLIRAALRADAARRRSAATSPGGSASTSRAAAARPARATGTKKIEMHFLPDVYVTCDVCKGTRYNRETLEVRYKGKNVADVLEMSVEEAAGLLRALPTDSGSMLKAAGRRRAGLRRALGQSADHAVGRRGPAHQAGGRTGQDGHRQGPCTSSTSRRPACTSPTSTTSLSVLQPPGRTRATRSSSSSTTWT